MEETTVFKLEKREIRVVTMKPFKSFVRDGGIPFAFLTIHSEDHGCMNEWYEIGKPISQVHPTDNSDLSWAPGYVDEHTPERDRLHNELMDSHGAVIDKLRPEHKMALDYYVDTSARLNRHLVNAHLLDLKLDPNHPDYHKNAERAARKQFGDDIDVDDVVRNFKTRFEATRGALSNAPALHRDIQVYTGVGAGFHVEEERKKTGGLIHLPAFTSTSIVPYTAAGFAWRSMEKDEKPYAEMVRIHVPKGSRHGMYLEGNVSHLDEREFLLNHGKNLRLRGEPTVLKQDRNGQYHPRILIHDADLLDD